ncbi:MAG: hypothetical protein IJ849_05730 [Selenomonadaceae bacterium]|nr:hypothetical protein [Selenomonadaceae bacterium]
MSITIDFNAADVQMLQAQATAQNISVEEFSHKTIMKALRNAEYLAKIDRGIGQMKAGTCKSHELIEA